MNLTIQNQPAVNDFVDAINNAELGHHSLQILGRMVFARAQALSHRVNNELLKPMSHWLDDPDWMKKFSVDQEVRYPWASYKKQQRHWKDLQKQQAAQRLKQYWFDIKQRQHLTDAMQLIPKLKNNGIESRPPTLCIREKNLIPILSPFSLAQQHARSIKDLFERFAQFPVSVRLPWRQIIISELSEIINLSNMKPWYAKDHKKDKISKFINALHLENEGYLTMDQDKPFGDIIMTPKNTFNNATINIMDKTGSQYGFDWYALNQNQKQKIITDITTNHLILKSSN